MAAPCFLLLGHEGRLRLVEAAQEVVHLVLQRRISTSFSCSRSRRLQLALAVARSR
jgi:hypothetical protein